uniref:Uncharacterized protein n=1 Tax=Nelumbo nucifera TaxID=4432 RepID=A0A822YM72_NELNU|nr:TPA_asm: hypothetical protein HUJ06_011250 [Nelumbo nucifera]
MREWFSDCFRRRIRACSWRHKYDSRSLTMSCGGWRPPPPLVAEGRV